MANSVIVTLRLPKALLQRADELVPKLRDNDEMMAMGRVSRSTVLRLAVLRGLEALEGSLPEANGPSPAGRGRNG
jgi:hypothetical protein